MRRKLHLLIASLGLFAQAFAQSTFTVNNLPGAAATYHSLQGALDSAAAGSVLLLQATGQNYGQGNISKPLVIYGAGYFLGQNNAPFTQANLNRSVVERLVFLPGSQGSLVSGLSLSPPQADASGTRVIFSGTSNITLTRCYVFLPDCGSQGCHPNGFVFSNSSNITVKQCYIDVRASLMAPINSSGIHFNNNIMVGVGDNFTVVGNYAVPFDYTLDHNSIYGYISEIGFGGGSFTNNVFMQADVTRTIYLDSPMDYSSHNVGNIPNIFPASSTNITNAPANTVFTFFSNPAISSSDGAYQLRPNSPAALYALDGTDAGAYGGAAPYVFSGIPAIPNIYFASPEQNATSAGGLKIRLKIKANN